MTSEPQARLKCRKCDGDKEFSVATFLEHVAYDHMCLETGETSHCAFKCNNCEAYFFGTMAAGDHAQILRHTVVPNVIYVNGRNAASYEWYNKMKQYGAIVGQENPQIPADPPNRGVRSRSPSPRRQEVQRTLSVPSRRRSPSPQRHQGGAVSSNRREPQTHGNTGGGDYGRRVSHPQEYQQQEEFYDEWEHNSQRSEGRTYWEATPSRGRFDSGFTEEHASLHKYDLIDHRGEYGHHEGHGGWRRDDRREEHVHEHYKGHGDERGHDKRNGQKGGGHDEIRDHRHEEREKRDRRHSDRPEESLNARHKDYRDGGRQEKHRGRRDDSRERKRKESETEDMGPQEHQEQRKIRSEEEIRLERRADNLLNKLANARREKAHFGQNAASPDSVHTIMAGYELHFGKLSLSHRDNVSDVPTSPTLPYSFNRSRLSQGNLQNQSGMDFSKLGGDMGRPPLRAPVVEAPKPVMKQKKPATAKQQKAEKLPFFLPPPEQHLDARSPWIPRNKSSSPDIMIVESNQDGSPGTPSSVQVLEADKTPIRPISDDTSVFVEEDSPKSPSVTPPPEQNMEPPHLVQYSDSEDDSPEVETVGSEQGSSSSSIRILEVHKTPVHTVSNDSPVYVETTPVERATAPKQRSASRSLGDGHNSHALADFCYEPPRAVQKAVSRGAIPENSISSEQHLPNVRQGAPQNDFSCLVQASSQLSKYFVNNTQKQQGPDIPGYFTGAADDMLSSLDFSNLPSCDSNMSMPARRAATHAPRLISNGNVPGMVTEHSRIAAKTPDFKASSMGIPRLQRSARREQPTSDTRSARERATSGWEARNLHGGGGAPGTSYSRYAGQRANSDVQTIRVMDEAPPRQPTPPRGSQAALQKQIEAQKQKKKERREEFRKKSLDHYEVRKRHHSEQDVEGVATRERPKSPVGGYHTRTQSGEITRPSYSERENSVDNESNEMDFLQSSPRKKARHEERGRSPRQRSIEREERSSRRERRRSPPPTHQKANTRKRTRSPPGEKRERRSYSRSPRCNEDRFSQSPSPRR